MALLSPENEALVEGTLRELLSDPTVDPKVKAELVKAYLGASKKGAGERPLGGERGADRLAGLLESLKEAQDRAVSPETGAKGTG
jgi:F0F1-type ATP synthase delta subunit